MQTITIQMGTIAILKHVNTYIHINTYKHIQIDKYT